MTKREALLALAERCQKAEGPDRVADFEIHRLLEPLLEPWEWPGGNTPAYTASIDAALTLVSEEMRDEIEITTLYQVARVGINLNHGPDDGPFYGSNDSNSIPLALCAASLRAHAHKEQDHD